MLWLLEATTLHRMIRAQENHRDLSVVQGAREWEAERVAREQAAEAAVRDGQHPAGMSLSNGTAEIRVDGVLTKRPDFWAMFFGGENTTYSSIRTALSFSASSPDVSEILFSVDSPGGQADGLIDLLDAISNVRQYAGKRMRTRAEQAQSAAYGIAARVGNIEATGRGATFGSIGTAVSYYVSPNVVTLTNSDSPDKRPDLTTAEGKAVVVKYLDQINHEFASAIADGRGVPLARVTDGFGRGASMTAPEALRLGLIDTIASSAPRAVHTSKGNSMADKDPESTQRAAIEAAEQRGVERERDRVLGHLTLGESCGDMSIALAAIRSGATQTAELTARYMSASMNRKDQRERQAESNAAETQLAGVGAASPATTPDVMDQAVALYQGQGEKSFVRG